MISTLAKKAAFVFLVSRARGLPAFFRPFFLILCPANGVGEERSISNSLNKTLAVMADVSREVRRIRERVSFVQYLRTLSNMSG